MRKKILTVVCIILLLSCGKNKNDEKEPGLLDLVEKVSDFNQISNEIEAIEEDGNQLENTPPISNESLKAIIPQDLPGYSRKKMSIGNQLIPDISMADAEYQNKNGDIIYFSIIDGAGETGSTMVAFARMGFSRDFEEETDTGYKKSTTINGYSAIEEVEKNDYDDSTDSKIEFLISKRFLISIEAKNLSMDNLKDLVNKFNIKELEGLIK